MALQRARPGDNRFGVYLRRLRERRKLTLEAAETLSATLETRVSSSYLSRLESGLTVPNLTKLSAISRVYDIPLTTLVEKFDVEQRRRRRPARAIPRDLGHLTEVLRRKLRSGAYIEALEIAVLAQQRLEQEATLAADYGAHGGHYLKLVECEAMVHLELYESAKFEAERFLEQAGLRMEHRLAAWQFYIGCCTKLGRFQLALAGLDQAETEARHPDAPPRTDGDLLLLRGNLLVLTRRFEEAIRTYGAALKVYRAQRNRLESCRARVHLGGILVELGKLSSAQRYLSRAVADAERSGYEQLRAIALCNLSALFHRRDDHARSEGCAFRASELAKSLGLHAVLFKSTFYLFKSAQGVGDRRAADAYKRMLAGQVECTLPPSPELDVVRELLDGHRYGEGR